jgi:hypothetical protein
MSRPTTPVPGDGANEGMAEIGVSSALAEIQAILRGDVDDSNLRNASVGTAQLKDASVTAPKLGLRLITGTVSSNGGRTSGTGFSSVRDSVGGYTITFDAALPGAEYPVFVQPYDATGVVPEVRTRSATAVHFVFRTVGGAGTDAGFAFFVAYL